MSPSQNVLSALLLCRVSKERLQLHFFSVLKTSNKTDQPSPKPLQKVDHTSIILCDKNYIHANQLLPFCDISI